MIDWSQPIEFEDGTTVYFIVMYSVEKNRALVKVPFAKKDRTSQGSWVYTSDGYYQHSGEPGHKNEALYHRIRNVCDEEEFKEDLT